MTVSRRFALFGAAALALSLHPAVAVANNSKTLKELASGTASWYGGKFHGRKTASGERFDKNAMTAAHRKLPFGSKVRVTHAKTGRSVIVRINDRGPFARNRVIDLSRAAATELGMINAGTAPVKLELVG